MKRIHGIMRGVFGGAFIGLLLGEGIAAFLRQTFGWELGAVGCPGALVGMIIGVLSDFIGPIRIFFNYITLVFLAIFCAWFFGRIGFAGGEFLGAIILGDMGHRIGGIVGVIIGVIFALGVTILNGIILIRKPNIFVDK